MEHEPNRLCDMEFDCLMRRVASVQRNPFKMDGILDIHFEELVNEKHLDVMDTLKRIEST